MKSYQTFRIVRAPEEPPLTAKDLRYFIRAYRTKSEWEVVELEDAGNDLTPKLFPKIEIANGGPCDKP